MVIQYKCDIGEDGSRDCKKISLRVRNFQSERIKVNDAGGNPIEIAAVIVWRVSDTAKAIFDVADYEQLATVQSETSLRRLANEYPYDDYEPTTTSLRAASTRSARRCRRSSRRARSWMPESKRFLLRLDPRLFEALRSWANDELRSITGPALLPPGVCGLRLCETCSARWLSHK